MKTALEQLEELTKEIQTLTFNFDYMFDSLPDPMCVTNDQNIFIKLNPAWVDSLGWSIKDLEGHNYLEFVHSEDLESTIESIKDLKANDVLSFKNRYKHKDGQWVKLEWSVTKYINHGATFSIARVCRE